MLSIWHNRKIPTWERIVCWFLILLGVAGGACATYAAVDNIVNVNFKSPCYVSNSLWGECSKDS